MGNTILILILGLFGLASLTYLIWWGLRFSNYLKAKKIASNASIPGNWPADFLERVLEYGRLLTPLSVEFKQICLGLTRQQATDPRAQALLTQYCAFNNINAENFEIIRTLAHSLLDQSILENDLVKGKNGAGLIDRLVAMGIAKDIDIEKRVKFSIKWIDVSPTAIALCVRYWREQPDSNNSYDLLQFLFNYFSAVWDPKYGNLLGNGDQKTIPAKGSSEFLTSAAEVFCAKANIPPADLNIRCLAIQTTFQDGDYLACFQQCSFARQEFGAPALEDEIWKLWGQCLIKLEGQDWNNFSRHQFTHLPADTTWPRLQEILDHACRLQPDDLQLLEAQASVYLGGKIPVARSLSVYERVLEKTIPMEAVIEQLVSYYEKNQTWSKLETAGRFLLQIQEKKEAPKSILQKISKAILMGRLSLDFSILERTFDTDPGDPALNQSLIEHYLSQDGLDPEQLVRIGHLLEDALPETLRSKQIQQLREKYILACLELSGAKENDLPKQSLPSQISLYLETGGMNPNLISKSLEANLVEQKQRMGALEVLMNHPPVERKYSLELGKLYSTRNISEEKIKILADTLEASWSVDPRFLTEDCQVASYLGKETELSPEVLQILITTLLTQHPTGWKEDSNYFLEKVLRLKKAESDLLRLVLVKLYSQDKSTPLQVWTLETLREQGKANESDSLKLLEMYDAGVGLPEEGPAQVLEKAEKLEQELTNLYSQADPQIQTELFKPLLSRMMNKPVEKLQRWEIDFLKLGTEKDLLPSRGNDGRFIQKLASYLLGKKDKRAVPFQQWCYQTSSKSTADASRLFDTASQLSALKTGSPFWFDVSKDARKDSGTQEKADQFLVELLTSLPKWQIEHMKAASDLLNTSHRNILAPLFIKQVTYGQDREFNHKLIELVSEDLSLGKDHAELLLEIADRREKHKDYNEALAASLLIENTIGGSEDLARRILRLLRNIPNRDQYTREVSEFLKLYRNTFDIISQMVSLARDPQKPFPFELAFAIVDRWGDLAAKQDAQDSFANDPSFIVVTKCEIYELYRNQMNPKDAQAMLRSIGKHSRQALSEEAGKRVEQIGEDVLFSSGQDDETRQMVAEILYGLGKLSAATWQFERLVDSKDFHKTAINSLEQITRRLESPRREIPALLTAYYCITKDAFESNQLETAESVIKKAKLILVEEDALEELTQEDHKRVMGLQEQILKLYQGILETHTKKARLSTEQTRDLADVFRLRDLWDKAGGYYNELATRAVGNNERSIALENAELFFDCYYRAGKGWWEHAARQILRILWGQEGVPPSDITNNFSDQEFRLMENVAVLFHSLAVDPKLKLDVVKRNRYKYTAQQLYERLGFHYIQKREYITRLTFDLGQTTPTILEPFDLVPHIREQGAIDIWTDVRYEKQDRLGGGEFADVYKVIDTQTKNIYAMKLIKAVQGRDPKILERFQKEGAFLMEIDHPNIVKCYDAGVQESRQFIIMDYINGQTLDDLITRRRREIPIQQRLRIFLEICGAVEYLHNQGILHRDLHPGNVLVAGEKFEEVKLTDFGLATMMDREGVGKSSRVNGRENYTPPEVFAGKLESPASEVYSLGAMLCFILTGWPRPDAALLRELELPDYFGLGEVIERALSNEVSARYQRVTELIQEIRNRTKMEFDFGAILQKVSLKRFQQIFKLGDEIGHGEAGVVYRAQDLRAPDLPDVAIKEISSSHVSGSIERRAEQFFRVRDLTHPNLVNLQMFMRVDGKLYVVMELVNGPSLANLMDSNEKLGKRFPPADCLRSVQDIAKGLAFVHEHGIVHGCVVPTNIMIEDKTRKTRLSDFAASVLFDGDQWHRSAMIRQYNYYLAPETSSNEISPSSDVYSLGWLLCQMVTGQRGQLSPNEIFSALEEVGHWNPSQMDNVVEIIENSTILDPSHRVYLTASDFLTELDKVVTLP
jgi:serine/threonine protein kinase